MRGSGEDSAPAASARSPWGDLRLPALRAVGLIVLLLLAAAVLYVQVAVSGRPIDDGSPIEQSQELLLVLTAAVFYRIGWLSTDDRGFAVLAAGFFSCLLFRELDGHLDAIRHGLWKYPFALVALLSIVYALRRGGVLDGLVRYTRDDSFNTMLAGVLSLLLFSRALGLGSLWRAFLGEEYAEEISDLAQEGTELLCYCLIFFSAACFYQTRLGTSGDSRGGDPRGRADHES